MRSLFTLVGAAIVIFGGAGWYLGWYKIDTEQNGSGHRTINIDLNTKKIAADVKKGEQKVEQAVSHSAPVQGTTIVPNVPVQQNGQPVLQGNGILTGFQVNGDGSVKYQSGPITLPPLVPSTGQPPQ